METTTIKEPDHRSALRQRNTHYLEKLQKVMDAAKTASQNLELRKKFIDRQNRMNYRNEYDRLQGELSHITDPKARRLAIQNMMDIGQLKDIGEYEDPIITPAPIPRGRAAIRTPGVRIRAAPKPRAKAKAKASPGRGRRRRVIDVIGGIDADNEN